MTARWIATGCLQNSGNVEYVGDDQPDGHRFYMYELEDPYGEDYRAGVTSAILLDRYKGLAAKASGVKLANLEMICRELQEAVDVASKVCGVSFADCSYYVPASSIK